MTTVSDWREKPAELLEELYALATIENCPPTLDQMAALVRRHGIDILFVPPDACPEAMGNIETLKVVIPFDRRDIMLINLVHEVSELYLRLPVQPEFHHPPTGQDEFHNVAALTAARLRQSLDAHHTVLIEQEAQIEAEISHLCAERRRQGQSFAAALQAGQDTKGLVIPSRKEVGALQSALDAATARLGVIQTRLQEYE